MTGSVALGTLRAMGVRFVVRSAEGEPVGEEIAYGFEQARVVIGRGTGADVRIPHLTVSETHASVHLDADGYAILDNDSTNGTRVNGARLSPGRKKRLRDGDLIEVGAYVLSFHSGVALAHAVTAERTAELARRLFRSSHAGARVGGPRLVVLTGPDTGKSLEVPDPPARLLIGSADSCQLVLADPEVAPEQAEVVRDLDGVLIRALTAGAPLRINEQSVAQRRLRDADELVLGGTRLLFEEPAEEPIDSLMAESDRALPPAAQAAERPSEPAAAEPPEPAPARARDSAAPRRAARPPLDADLLIYTLAGIVIALSVAGLIALFSAN